MWWRVLVPTWRFFDTVGAYPLLLIKVDGTWRPAFTKPSFNWYSPVFNPKGGLYHARNNLLERLVQEIASGAEPEELVSFALVRDLARGYEFKVTVGRDDVLHSQGASK